MIMPLSAGAKLGPYEILAPIGAGGMGEVYRARDTTLGREVAIKVLPDALARDPERLARFKREAKVLASLNHPNVGQIYGVESQALVMELIEGETISSLIKPGPLPIETALHYAVQIAEALEAAHGKGIVHRDLKPSNIMVTPEGQVKVLDFGLAKAGEEPSTPQDPTNSPTETLSPTLTGVILGTAAYMSPEQARGATVDRRTDIWSFGVVLYEMLAGKRAFRANRSRILWLACCGRSQTGMRCRRRRRPVSASFCGGAWIAIARGDCKPSAKRVSPSKRLRKMRRRCRYCAGGRGLSQRLPRRSRSPLGLAGGAPAAPSRSDP
jgi:serine/threonine protein kinase